MKNGLFIKYKDEMAKDGKDDRMEERGKRETGKCENKTRREKYYGK